jgi:hypothetical protein
MKTIKRNLVTGVGLLCLVLTGPFTRMARADSVITLSALGADDLLDFTSYPSTTLGTSFAALSADGLDITVSEPSSSFEVLRQSPPGPWFGHFPAGTAIVADQGPIGPVTFSFSTAVRGFGLTLDNGVGGAYGGTIEEFNGTTSLGKYTITSPGPGLMFLGVLDATSDITSVTIATAGAGGSNDFAFGNLSLADGTPEPASIVSVVLGLAGLLLKHRFRGPQKSQG